MKKEKEILRQQLELLAEQSENAIEDELYKNSIAMCEISKQVRGEKMIKKIYQELVLIRKELQAIRTSKESDKKLQINHQEIAQTVWKSTHDTETGSKGKRLEIRSKERRKEHLTIIIEAESLEKEEKIMNDFRKTIRNLNRLSGDKISFEIYANVNESLNV